jgi:protein gp37
MFRPACKKKYSGELRLDEKAMKKNLGSGNTWFVCAQNDLFAEDASREMILQVLEHCRHYYNNIYVFQSKNPIRFSHYKELFPRLVILGTTIETNRNLPGIGNASRPRDRMEIMELVSGRKFVTIEPILNFDVDVLSSWMVRIRPEFVNIGADSKKHNLPEPSADKILALIDAITNAGIEVRKKSNLHRILNSKVINNNC